MKIFSSPERSSTKTSEGPKKTGKNKTKHQPAAKTPVSDREIREKLASHVETSNGAKSQLLKKNNQSLGAGFMNPDVKRPIIPAEVVPGEVETKNKSLKESHLLLSDVQLNDPSDTNTQEKLKSVLRSGAFNFNPKEKDTLERILAGS